MLPVLPLPINNASVAPNLLGCWGRGTLRDAPRRFVEAAPAGRPNANYALPPYVFAVPELQASCPKWFELNLLNTRHVQQREAGASTVLVEGPSPKCAHFSRSHDIEHHAVPPERDRLYKSIFASAEDATMWSAFGPEKGALFRLSVVRYFYLGDFIRATGVEKLIYLDWDTVAYIAAPAAWRVMDAADPPVHFAAGTGYPPFGTANNVFTMFTNASLYDYLLYVATHLLLKLPPECGPSAMPAGREAVGMINSYTDMKQLFTYGLYAHRESIPPYVGSSDGDWLRDMPTLASTSGKCDDSNVNCNARWRWHTPPGSSPYGAHFPVWAFHPPKYRIFNLYEPFGRGNLVSDLPIEISNKGANLTGFKGELSGVASALPHGPLFDLNGIYKMYVWGSGGAPPGGGFCAPHFSQTRPRSPSSPLWGWHQAVPASDAPARDNHAQRRWFRAWAVTFSTPYFKERWLPSFLLVGSAAAPRARGVKPRREEDCPSHNHSGAPHSAHLQHHGGVASQG